MSNANSPGNTHNNGSSCSLVSSLFPTSCRGRAEAFARSLQRRLTSLSGETNTNEDLSESTETTWLNSAPAKKTNDSTSSNLYRTPSHIIDQQQYLSFSPEGDLYYELNLDSDEDGSIAEEDITDELKNRLSDTEFPDNKELINCNERNKHSNEFSCNSVSIVNEMTPESEESEMYFDLLSSDTERKSEHFFDPISTSESEASTRTACHTNGLVSNSENNIVPNRLSTDESSESSYSLRIPKDESIQKSTLSLDTSLNTRSSTETTSPSHESLWSDNSTISMLEDSPIRFNVSYEHLSARTSKSLSDSQIFINFNKALIKDSTKSNQEENNCINNSNRIKSLSENDVNKCVFVIENITFKCDTDTNNLKQTNFTDTPKAFALSDPRLQKETTEILNNKETTSFENNTINSVSADKMSRVLEMFNSIDKTAMLMNSKDVDYNIKSNQVDKSNNGDDGNDDSDEEQMPPRVRRCSSLKTGKTPPDTPCRKKIVRFADVLGLDLADVRTFLDEIPKIPNSAYSDLIYDDSFQKELSPVQCGIQAWSAKYPDHSEATGSEITRGLERALVPLFQQPSSISTFLDTLREKIVRLENAVVQDLITFCVHGTVRVLNLDFHKSVHIRYTLNSWSNYSDLQATYVPNSCDGLSDKFSFILYCHTLSVGQRLEFAVRFQCKGMQYWDNNNGANYCFQCISTKPTTTNYSAHSKTSSANTKEWGPMFY